MRDGEWAAGSPTPCPSTLRPGGDHGHQGRAGPRPTGGSATSTLAPESSREPSASREPEGRGHPAGTAESLGVPFGRMGTERPTGRKDSWPTKHRASQPLAPVPELREQGSVAFEDVAVDFSPREWALLTPAQRRLYREVVLDTFQALASVGDQKQLSSQQDFLAEKLSNKQKIARFIRNDTWASFVGENWEEHYRGKRKKQRRYLRVSVKKSRHVGGRGPGRRLRGSLAGPGRRYECERCGNVFTHPSSLQRHIRIHTGQKPHKCAQCGKAFSRPSYLRTHEKTHSGEKPHACGVCGKAFLRPYSLTVHARVHTGEKPFACTRCGRPFSCPKSFRAHVLAHTAGKPYRCAQCGKAFRCPRSARVHARLHAGERLHECPRCGKAYGWLASLQKHVRVHDGEKPYACACCGKAFGWPSSLHKHVRAHARKTWASGAPAGARLGRPAPKPAPEPSGTCQETLACATCGKAFAQRSSLRKHTRMHTLEQSGAADNQENPLGAPGPSTQLSSEELSRRGSVQHRLRNHTGKESCQEESNEPGDVEHCCSPGHDREAGPGETKLQPHPSQLRGLVSLHHPRENLEALPEK